jgi:sphingomyelin phosphodiesterase
MSPTPVGAAEPHGKPEGIRVLTHNVLFLPTAAVDYSSYTRADLIASAGYLRGYDIVLLQEMIDNGPSDRLLVRMAGQYPHRTPVLGRTSGGWDRTAGRPSHLPLGNGGVVVLSKWPIRQRVQYLFAHTCGPGQLSGRGFIYIELDVRGTPVHVVGTHAQSDNPGCPPAQAPRVRASQFREIAAFLDARRIPTHQQVFIAGDLNVDRYGPEYGPMLRNLDAAAPDSYTGHPYSHDAATNRLAGAESITRGYLRRQLDYVLCRNGHARPAGWANSALLVPAPDWTLTRWLLDYPYTAHSDHYPVTGTPTGS